MALSPGDKLGPYEILSLLGKGGMGKRQRQYKLKDYATPYQKLKSLPGAQDYCKEGIGLESLERMAKRMSDTEFAGKMRAAKTKLLRGCKIESPLPPPRFL
jgi:hypothetical protein